MEKKNSPLATYYQYTSLGFQMVTVMGISMWLGLKLDRYCAYRFPVFLSTFSLLATILCTYGTIRKLLHQHKQQQQE